MSHTAGMDTSGLPVPDAIPFEKLQENLFLNLFQEIKFQPNLHELPQVTQEDEITIAARNKSAYVLRCLKVLYDLSSDIFLMAINLMDRFLTKMKARQKHMACISVSAFYIASSQQMSIDAEHLISVSQCRCSTDDLKRMTEIIQNKLEWAPGTQPITALTFLRLFNNLFRAVAIQLHLGDLYTSLVMESDLIIRLEMVACDGNCSSFKSSEIALVLLCISLDTAFNRLNTNGDANMSNDGSSITHHTATMPAHEILKNELAKLIMILRRECNISDQSFCSTRAAMNIVLNKYNAQEQTPHRQHLIWKLSSRTASVLRPTERFRCVLPAIAEHVPSSNKIRKNKKNRNTQRQKNKRY